MSEIPREKPPQPYEGLLPIDEYTEGVIREAESIEAIMNELLERVDVTSAERSEIDDTMHRRIAAMNKACPHIGQQVVISGDIESAYYNTEAERYESIRRPCAAVPVWSAGYAIRMFAEDDGEDARMRIGHLFNVGTLPTITHKSQDLVQYSPAIHAFALPGRVDIETFGRVRWHDADRLKREIPSLYQEFHGCIEGIDDECEALHNLASMNVPVDYDIPTDTRMRFEAYAFEQLGFDKELPYELAVDGIIARREKSVSRPVTFADNPVILATVEHLTLSPRFVLGEGHGVQLSRDMHWTLHVRECGREYGDIPRRYAIPASGLLEMQSSRYILYQEIESRSGATDAEADYEI